MSNWQILNSYKFDPGKKDALKLLLAGLLEIRGVTAKKDIDEFLSPKIGNVNLENLKIDKAQAEKAVSRIKSGIKKKEKMVIYTDYDCDGILSGAILWENLFSLKADIMPFVPDRQTEGYGLSVAGIDKIKKNINPALIITVDHGITKVKEVAYAKSLGIDVIIVDHHLIQHDVPDAVAIVHTTLLCATGLAWVFSNFIKGETLIKYLDLAAIATVADLVPLKGANRAIVKFGLLEINKTKRIGLSELILQAGLKKGEIDTYALSHILAPRLNASGRLTNAIDSLRLICTKDKDRAVKLAEELNSVNKNRQTMTKKSALLAVSQVVETESIIFASHESFHQGIIGLIAGKLVDSYKRPAIVVSIGEEYCKASVRSVKGINIVDFLSSASELLIDMGGHPMAAGFTVHRDNLKKLRLKLMTVSKTLIASANEPETLIDLEIDPSDIDIIFYNELMALAPFGQGNPEPVFAGYGLNVVESRLVGKEKNHLKLVLVSPKNPGKFINAIGFNLSEHFNLTSGENLVDIAYQVEKDNWRGGDSLNFKLKDVRLSD